jgi:sulfur carrier protein ThiS
MTMSAKPSTTEKNGVMLIRPGVEGQEYTLPEGATLADLLQQAQAQTEGRVILIDGRRLEEALVLQPGMTISIVPDERWRETFGMFKDDAAFNEMVEAGRAYRESLREAALKEIEDGEA